MRGLGLGFTPSGDDFLCGLMAGYNYALANLRFDTVLKIELIFFNSEGKNIVSNSFLRASHEGKVNAKVGRLMKALGGRDKTELEAAVQEAKAEEARAQQQLAADQQAQASASRTAEDQAALTQAQQAVAQAQTKLTAAASQVNILA